MSAQGSGGSLTEFAVADDAVAILAFQLGDELRHTRRRQMSAPVAGVNTPRELVLLMLASYSHADGTTASHAFRRPILM